jgi:hypothetical protein
MWSEADLAAAEQVMGEEAPAFTAEPPVFAAPETSGTPAPVDAEAEADVFAAPVEAAPASMPTADAGIDLSQADVFSSEATDRLAAAVRERRPVEAEDEDLPDDLGPAATTTVAVGNTLRTVEIAARPATEAAPALAVVEAADQIAELSAEARLVTFG